MENEIDAKQSRKSMRAPAHRGVGFHPQQKAHYLEAQFDPLKIKK